MACFHPTCFKHTPSPTTITSMIYNTLLISVKSSPKFLVHNNPNLTNFPGRISAQCSPEIRAFIFLIWGVLCDCPVNSYWGSPHLEAEWCWEWQSHHDLTLPHRYTLSLLYCSTMLVQLHDCFLRSSAPCYVTRSSQKFLTRVSLTGSLSPLILPLEFSLPGTHPMERGSCMHRVFWGLFSWRQEHPSWGW